jgi:capsular polysaccharide export protein
MVNTRSKLLKNTADWTVYGISKWKHPFIPGFLGFKSKVVFIGSLDEPLDSSEVTTGVDVENVSVPLSKRVLIWAASYTAEIEKHFINHNQKVYLLEDGFLRSVGLGINHARPLSLVIDSRSMYYDCSKESDLEHILNFDEFDQYSLSRAKALITQLVELKLTKYNLKSKNKSKQACLDLIQQAKSQGKKIVLVPGQVESDASIKKGSPQIKTNLDLLQGVASNVTDAFVIYKPHPDVLTQLRPGELKSAEEFYDLQITDMDMADLLEVVDEVHTMTSLTGFEALLRGKRVVCYGLPFYAGWGLTQDVLSCERRQRKLCLEELVIGALIKYPTYCDPKTGHLIDVETAVELLAQQKEQDVQGLPLHKRVFRWFRLRVFMPIGLLSKK